MLFSPCCPIILFKYDFARRIALNDHSLIVFVEAATSTNLAKCMTCGNNNFMLRGNFYKYVQTADKVILASFSVVN